MTARRVVVTVGSDVKTRRIDWWEPDLIVRHAINLVAAREGMGKSSVAASWSARETLNGGVVLWIGTEESREHAQAPRLIVAGADMQRVVFVDLEVDEKGTHGSLQLPLDLELIEEVIEARGVTMIVLDPCKGAVPADFRGNDDVAVRQYLEPLGKLCDRQRVTLLGLVHFGKRESTDPGKLILGSSAWSQVARSVVSIAEDSETGTRVLTGTKSNYSPSTRSIEFQIVSESVDTSDGPSVMGAVEWIGDTTRDARDLLGEARRDDREDEHDYTSDLQSSWLYGYLADARRAGQVVRPKEAVAFGADNAGVSRASVFRLFEKLANAGMAASTVTSGFPKATHWSLSGETAGSGEAQSQGGETTETTGSDQAKPGETTGDLFNGLETTGDTAPDQDRADGESPVVSVVSSISHDTPGDAR